MKCEEVRAALLAGEDGSDQTAIEAHLGGCRECRAEQPVIERLRAMLASPSLWEVPSNDLGDRIVDAILRHRDSPRRLRRTWVAAAAAVLVVGASVVGIGLLGAGTPDWTLELVAAESGTSGVALVDGWVTENGTRMVIEVSGIEEAPAGHYYEVWLTAPDGRHVSAGTFKGPGTITAFAGVRRSEFPRVWITLESADGDLGPSSETYFDMPK